MSFAIILVVAIVTIIIVTILYYFFYYRNLKPSSFLTSTVYTTGGLGNDTIANVPMMTPTDVSQFLGENFTLSYYINMNNIGGGIINKYVPLVWIVGVGALVVDLNGGDVYMVITSAPIDPSNDAPSVNTIKLSDTNSGLFLNKWNQLTLTISGINACVYLNGNMIGNCIPLANVTLASPTGVYFLQGQGPPATITSVQAWGNVLSQSVIAANYKNTNDGTGTPINYQTGTITLSDLVNSLINLFCFPVLI